MKLTFFVGGRPAPQQRPIFHGGKFSYSPKSEFYHSIVAAAYRVRPTYPITEAVKLTVRFCFLTPRCREGAIYNTARPDLDNLEKTVMDALTVAKIWQDDSVVVVKMSCKAFRQEEGAEITVETIKNIRDF